MTTSSTGSDLPLYLEDVDARWLTHVLQNRFPGVKVEACRRTGGHRGTSMSACFVLTYSDRAGHDLPESVYVKGGFDDKWRKRVYQALQQEALFYNEVAPDIDLNIPGAYYAAINDAPQGIVVLEDLRLRPGDVRFASSLAHVSEDDVAAVLENIAKLHAQWWGDPRLNQYESWREPQRIFLKYLYRPSHWDELVACKHGELLERALVDSATAKRSLETLWDMMDSRPRTFLHGDLHGGNIFYEADGRPGFLDWQLCFAGNYAHDMSWIIVTALNVEQRRKHERDLIKHYLGALGAHRGDAPKFDDAWLSYRQNMAHALASYGAVPRDMGAPDIVERSAERVFHAALDHDVLDALGMKN
ncbi:phosphotransferase [Hyphomonas chukchiensis]|nr:phosphotransferase [Hyphomonas chukchiensis]